MRLAWFNLVRAGVDLQSRVGLRGEGSSGAVGGVGCAPC